MNSLILAVGAVVAFTVALSPRHPEPPVATAERSVTQEPDGKQLYLKNCKQCHGVLGEPTKAAQRKYEHIASFVDPAFFARRSEDSIVTVLKNGKGRDMKSFTDKLSDSEMHAVARYIRTLAKDPGREPSP